MAHSIPHLLPPEIVKRSVWEDRHERRVNNWITPWDFREPIDVGLVMVPLSKTSILTGCHGAPNALRQAFQLDTTYSPDYDVDMTPLRVRELGEIGGHTTDVLRSLRMIEEAATAVFAHQPPFFPVFVGGDHAVTAPLSPGLAGRPAGAPGSASSTSTPTTTSATWTTTGRRTAPPSGRPCWPACRGGASCRSGFTGG